MQKRKFFIILAAILVFSLIGLSATCLAPGESPALELEIYDGPDYSESDNMCYYRIEVTATGMPEPEIEFDEDDNISPLGPGRVEVGVGVGDSYALTATATNSEGSAIVSIILKGDCSKDVPDEETAEEGVDADGDADTNTDSDSDGEAPTISLEIYEGPFPVESTCVYRVKAIVTGSPNPTIIFSKDDSGGSWGTKKAQVNINNPGDTYTLTATATNSEGSATDSIDLSWGCEEPEPEPEPEPEADETYIEATPEISGYITVEGSVIHSDQARMGDAHTSDNWGKGYLSFDISGLHGKTVQDAEINFINFGSWGDPESLASYIVVKVYNYVRLDPSDFAVGGVQLVNIPISAASYTISGNTLKNELQDVLDNEIRDYFQIKLGLDVATNDNGMGDGIIINCNEAVLYISYTD